MFFNSHYDYFYVASSNQSSYEPTNTKDKKVSIYMRTWQKIISLINSLKNAIFDLIQDAKEIFEEDVRALRGLESKGEVEARLEKKYYERENSILKAKLEYLDSFIRERPGLYKLYQEYKPEYQRGNYVSQRRRVPNYNPHSIISQATDLSLEHFYLERTLSEEIRFIKSYKEIYELFEKHVHLVQHNKTQSDCDQQFANYSIELFS